MNKPFSLALITGASSGIGEGLCYLFADQGIDLIITGRNKDKLQEVADRLKSKVEVEVTPADLSNPEGRKTIIKKIWERVPDLVINNAGFGLYGEALTHPTEDSARMLEVDGKAVLELTLEGARAMIGNEKKGVILNVSSVAAYQMFPGFAVYAASKAFVKSFSEALDFEVSPHGVRVLTNCPGVVKTNFSARASDDPKRAKKSRDSMAPMELDFAVKEIWRQILKRKRVHAFDWRYRFTTWLTQIIPTPLLARALMKAMEGRAGDQALILDKPDASKD